MQAVLARVSSSTAAAVISNSTTGEGAVYQALYQPSFTANGKSISWQGILHSLFIDSQGYLREDTNSNGQLDNYYTDSIVELYYDANVGRTLIQRYGSNDGGATVVKSGLPQELTDLDTLWNATDRLSALGNVTTQRTYGSSAANGRYIVTTTGSDADSDGYPDLIDFDTNNFATGGNGYEERLLGTLPAGLAVSDLVNYIRGQEISGLRNRTIDYDGNGTEEVWRLGDIVHSTPLVVGSPSARYANLYNDTSYAAFKDHYADRRHVVYVGSNDGMLHAFNAGFWNASTKGYDIAGSNGETQHPLGSELWAYIPKPALPHLQWLTEDDYPHVYYVDGIPQQFDVNIFDDDTDHPDGWGTILVVGMRLGGGSIAIDSDGNGSDDETLSSVYMIFDVTNPEVAPKLLAELSPSDQGFTTARPMIVKKRIPDNNAVDWEPSSIDTNKWYLLFGSGPDNQTSVTSGRNPDVYLYDLGDEKENDSPVLYTLHSNAAGSTDFFGDVGVVDWDLDYVDDYAYFGTIGGNASSPTGDVYRLELNDNQISSNKWPLTVFADLDDPVGQRPTFAKDSNDDQWMFVGSGRFYTLSDNTSSAQHYLYGLKEPKHNNGSFTYGTIDRNDLLDVSGATVYIDGSADVPSDNSLDTFSDIVTEVASLDGWYRELSYDGTNPSGRVLGRAALVSSAVVFAEYEPNADLCSPEGTSYLYALNFNTGTASTDLFFGSIDDDSDPNTVELARDKVTLGQGLVTDPVIHKNEGGVQVITQGSSGAFIRDTTQDDPTAGTTLNVDSALGGRQSWREVILK